MSHWASAWAYEQDIQPCGRKFVLVALANFADEDGFCYPSQATLSKMTGQDLRSVQRHLKALEADNLIVRKPRWKGTGGRNSDGYTLQAPSEKLKPKTTKCQVSKATDFPDDKLSPDLLENKVDPSVKKEPPLPPKRKYGKSVEDLPPKTPPPPYYDDPFLKKLEAFARYRKKAKRPLEGDIAVAFYADLAALGSSERAIAEMDRAMAKGWLGIFPEKSEKSDDDERPWWMAGKK